MPKLSSRTPFWYISTNKIYIKIGKGDTFEFDRDKFITGKLKLEHEVPIDIYREFVEKV